MPTVEERKIISLGGRSLLIVLPKPWVDYYHLRAGDKVVITTNGELRVRPKRRSRATSKLRQVVEVDREFGNS